MPEIDFTLVLLFFSLAYIKTHFLCSEDVGRSGQRNVSHNTIQANTILCYISPEKRAAVEVKILLAVIIL